MSQPRDIDPPQSGLVPLFCAHLDAWTDHALALSLAASQVAVSHLVGDPPPTVDYPTGVSPKAAEALWSDAISQSPIGPLKEALEAFAVVSPDYIPTVECEPLQTDTPTIHYWRRVHFAAHLIPATDYKWVREYTDEPDPFVLQVFAGESDCKDLQACARGRHATPTPTASISMIPPTAWRLGYESAVVVCRRYTRLPPGVDGDDLLSFLIGKIPAVYCGWDAGRTSSFGKYAYFKLNYEALTWLRGVGERSEREVTGVDLDSLGGS